MAGRNSRQGGKFPGLKHIFSVTSGHRSTPKVMSATSNQGWVASSQYRAGFRMSGGSSNRGVCKVSCSLYFKGLL